MFRRILLDNWMAIFPACAFVTALTIYLTITIKTWRMKPAKVQQFAHLPLQD